MPAVIAFRAMAAAIQAIFRSQDRSGFAKSWSRDQLALGFLVGALKCEWYGDQGESSDASDMAASLEVLRDRFGFARREPCPDTFLTCVLDACFIEENPLRRRALGWLGLTGVWA